jgi:hypothetical protein
MCVGVCALHSYRGAELGWLLAQQGGNLGQGHPRYAHTNRLKYSTYNVKKGSRFSRPRVFPFQPVCHLSKSP